MDIPARPCCALQQSQTGQRRSDCHLQAWTPLLIHVPRYFHGASCCCHASIMGQCCYSLDVSWLAGAPPHVPKACGLLLPLARLLQIAIHSKHRRCRLSMHAWAMSLGGQLGCQGACLSSFHANHACINHVDSAAPKLADRSARGKQASLVNSLPPPSKESNHSCRAPLASLFKTWRRMKSRQEPPETQVAICLLQPTQGVSLTRSFFEQTRLIVSHEGSALKVRPLRRPFSAGEMMLKQNISRPASRGHHRANSRSRISTIYVRYVITYAGINALGTDKEAYQ